MIDGLLTKLKELDPDTPVEATLSTYLEALKYIR